MTSLAVPLTVVDFLSECAFDLQSGRLQPLAHYLARYPAHTEAVAREYLDLVDARDPSGQSAQRLGRYELLRELARGGQGRVHLGRDPALGRFVALKVLELTGATDTSRRERFRREIEAVVRLDHPHVCRLFEADVDHEPPYAVMELVPGRSLAELILLGERASAASGGVVRPQGGEQVLVFVRFFELVARALHTVHAAGIVHRDLKPANLMLTTGGEPRVLDFGLASPAERIGEVTLTDSLLGTLPYMSPEQLKSGGKVDRRSDVFGLGTSMIECYTGERAFTGRSPETRLESIAAGLPWAVQRRLPPDLRAIFGKATANRQEDRYASCLELAEELQRVREHRPVLARRSGALLAAGRWCIRHPWLTAWMGACALAVVATWRAAEGAREALAASHKLEAGVLTAVRSFDPWLGGSGTDTASAVSMMQGDFAAEGDGTRRLAMHYVRRGAIAEAQRELGRPGVPQDELTAALEYACALIGHARASDGEPPEFPSGDPARIADHLAAIAGELCRHRCWSAFDAVTGGALDRLAEPALAQTRNRQDLLSWRIQAACIRRELGSAGLIDEEKKLQEALHGKGCDPALDAEEAMLRVAIQVVPGTAPLQALRGRTANLATRCAKGEPGRALRVRALDAGFRFRNEEKSAAQLAAIRESQIATHGAGHPCVVETTLRLAQVHGRMKSARYPEWVAAAWAAAQQMAAGNDDLLTSVLVEHAAVGAAGLDTDSLTDLRARAIQQCLRHWGPQDRRTLEAMAKLPLDLTRTPEASAWIELVLAHVPRDDDGDQARDRILARVLAQSRTSGRPLSDERHSLAMQAGADTLRRGNGQDGRGYLTHLWLELHEWPYAEDLVTGMTASVQQWRRYLGADDPGEGLLPAMLAGLGAIMIEQGHLGDAQLLLRTAVHSLATQLGKDDPDWIVAAESLPSPDQRTRGLLANLARLSDRLGDDQASVRLWRCAAPPQTAIEKLLEERKPDAILLQSYAAALLRVGDHREAEAQLLMCLDLQKGRSAPADEVAVTKRQLKNLYLVTDQRQKAAELDAVKSGGK
jgi:hypothetical protein